MKKLIALLVLVLMITAACSPAAPADEPTDTPADAPESGYADGKYFAMADEFAENGWKETVALEVKDGKITDVDWNAVSNQLGIDKRTAVEQGKYPMVAAGDAQAEWDEQADKAEAYLIEVQDPTSIELDEEGRTDAISGVSIHVNGLTELAQKALDAGVTTPGPYTDGTYHQEAADFGDSGWKEFVDFVVMNGNIVAAKWNAINEEDPELDKITAVAEGKYPMVASGGAQAEWDVQAKAVEDYLLETQNLDIEYSNDEGNTDAISGVSIHVNSFYDLIKQALGL
ncbi:MAG TPA: FMN-binding protein [Tissierellia bacterium]|nr:FMN-binding protein [Tissierellia bacterium]